MKVSGVSLANNHTFDYGTAGFLLTVQELEDAGIVVFGAGENLSEAKRPLSLAVPQSAGGESVDLYAAFRWRRVYQERYSSYAGKSTVGAASLSRKSAERFYPKNPNALNVFYPHWGSDYTWVSTLQQEVAQTLAQNGFDLTVGHGTHSIQELELVGDMPVAYGIGNGVFQAGGRFRRYAELRGILPYGFWALLQVSKARTSLRLYPVRADNRRTGYQPGPVDAEEFDRVLSQLAPGIRSFQGPEHAITEGLDNLGYYIDVPVPGKTAS